METYGNTEVARALGIPVRRLEGWNEQGVFTSRRREQGRRRYTFDEVVKLAALVELQRLFGPKFRPGPIGHRIAKQPAEDFGIARLTQSDSDPILLVYVVHRDRAEVHMGTQSRLQTDGVLDRSTTCLRINATRLARQVEMALER